MYFIHRLYAFFAAYIIERDSDKPIDKNTFSKPDGYKNSNTSSMQRFTT